MAAVDSAVAAVVDQMASAADLVVFAVVPVVFVVADAVAAVVRVDAVAVPVAAAVARQVFVPVEEGVVIVFVRRQSVALSDLFGPAVFFCQLFPGFSG